MGDGRGRLPVMGGCGEGQFPSSVKPLWVGRWGAAVVLACRFDVDQVQFAREFWKLTAEAIDPEPADAPTEEFAVPIELLDGHGACVKR